MMQRVFPRGGLSRAGFGAVLGAAVLLGAPRAWSQETKAAGGQPKAEARDDADRGGRGPRPEGAGERRPGGDARFWEGETQHPLHSYHTYSVKKEREEVEILEAQLAAKRAHVRLAEARLKEAQDQLAFLKKKGGSAPEEQERIAMIEAELPVLEAELDAERAEIREPQILLQHARQWLQHLQRIGQQEGFPGRAGLFGRMGIGPQAAQATRARAGAINEEVEELRAQVESLRRQVEDAKREAK